MSGYQQLYQRYQDLVESYLERRMDQLAQDSAEYAMPLIKAMRYSLLSGGKRLRPVLLLASYGVFKQDLETALPFAAGLEMIHTYSLIHDDLPCMDDDALRRGKPTNHVVHGEALALLAGDALLNLAFEIMSESQHPQAIKALHNIAARAGSRGMIAGQTADITLSHQEPTLDKVTYIHQHKTADLFHGAVLSGLILVEASSKILDVGEQYARHLGLSFQMVDDLLDLEGDAALLGKDTNKDEEQGKLTWPALRGIDRAREDAAAEIGKAVQAAEEIEGPGGFLAELARRALKRVQ